MEYGGVLFDGMAPTLMVCWVDGLEEGFGRGRYWLNEDNTCCAGLVELAKKGKGEEWRNVVRSSRHH